MPEQFEIERYQSAKKRILECEKSIENCLQRIKDYEGFMRQYEESHKLDSEFVSLFERLYPELKS